MKVRFKLESWFCLKDDEVSGAMFFQTNSLQLYTNYYPSDNHFSVISNSLKMRIVFFFLVHVA